MKDSPKTNTSKIQHRRLTSLSENSASPIQLVLTLPRAEGKERHPIHLYIYQGILMHHINKEENDRHHPSSASPTKQKGSNPQPTPSGQATIVASANKNKQIGTLLLLVKTNWQPYCISTTKDSMPHMLLNQGEVHGQGKPLPVQQPPKKWLDRAVLHLQQERANQIAYQEAEQSNSNNNPSPELAKQNEHSG
ncbi:hypothetical protein Nepgr_026644 [Nepenthes gracilis]|uniref:Uncharacterized protein n=1 Tax=Nepenthes gracilis TaxID=150966 RepID=A0AAD3TA45_NEPGR|nr:hypothetical protein Nepgr_026644 [Nepenthes gracilis]